MAGRLVVARGYFLIFIYDYFTFSLFSVLPWTIIPFFIDKTPRIETRGIAMLCRDITTRISNMIQILWILTRKKTNGY